jgi:hypothetical protein
MTGGWSRRRSLSKTKAQPVTQRFSQEAAVKTCTKCREMKRADEFYRDKGHRDGLTSACKPCMKAQATTWQKTNRERSREIKRLHGAKRRLGGPKTSGSSP